MQALAYIRWSTLNQEDGDSLKRQTDLVVGAAKENGWTLDPQDIHVESGKSAYHGRNRAQNGKLRAIEDRAERGELAGRVLIVEAMDRLSRQEPLESLNLLVGLCKKGLTIYEAGTRTTYDTAKINETWANLVVALAKAGEAHDSSKLKARRVSAAWRKTQTAGRTKDGKADPRLCPAWMTAESGEFELIPSRAEVITGIFHRALNGLGQRAIAAWANEQREKLNWPEGPWDIRAVGFILKDRRVLGEYSPNKRTGPNSREAAGEPIKLYPEVIDTETWHRTQQSVESRRSSGGPRSKCVNVLSHLARCTYINAGSTIPCGEKMNMRPQKNGPTQLTCSSFNRGRGCKCNASYRYTETLQGIFQHVLPLAMRVNHKAENSAAGKIAIARAELAETEARLAKLADRIMDSDDEHLFAAYDRAKARFKAEQAAVRAMESADERISATLAPADLAAEAQALRDQLDDPEARMRLQVILDGLIDAIYFDVETRGSTIVLLGGYIAIKLDKLGNYLGHVDALNQITPMTHQTREGPILVDPRPNGQLHSDPLLAIKLERAREGMVAGDLRKPRPA